MKVALAALAVVACKHDPSPSPSPSPPPAPSALGSACTQLPFEATTSVPETSDAAWLDVAGRAVIVTTSDSGDDGAYGLIDPETGATLETGKLPLGDASDDIEGVAVRDGVLYGVTSSGWMRAWKRSAAGSGFDLVDGPYALGPVDLPDKSSHDRPPKTDGMVCGAHGMNCGRNYEGLCLLPHPAATDPCTGFVVAKADGHLYCLVADGTRFAVRRTPSLELGKPGTMADCAFAADADDLYVAANAFAGNEVSRVVGWRDLATAHVELVGAIGFGFDEGVAVRGDVVYRFSDTGGSPSLITKFRCTPAAR